MSKLALFGGEKTININQPHYIWPPITNKTRQAVLQQLDESISIYNRSGIIAELENNLTQYHGVKYALLTNSGTTALYSMFVGAQLGIGDEVICPTYTFYATVTPLFFTGATPVLVDCDINGNISPEAIREKITSKTKAIVITHMWGIPCDMDAITAIAKEYNLLLLEDGSHAHGATYKGQKVGSFGTASAFSLQGQKTLSGGEGGFLLTNSEEIYYRALMLGHYNKRCRQEIPSEHYLHQFAVTGMGLKLRIHPLAAAIANQQLTHLDEILAQRRQMLEVFKSELEGLSCICFPTICPEVEPSWYALVLQYQPQDNGNLSRDKFYQALQAEGCSELDIPNSTCPLNYHPLFQQPQTLFPEYKSMVTNVSFPNADLFYQKALKLPVWHETKDIKLVKLYAQAFKKVINNYQELLV